MTEERLIALLAALVARGKLTPDEADTILGAFRAGDLPESVWPDLTAAAFGPASVAPLAALAALLAALRLLRPSDVRSGVRELAGRLVTVLRPATAARTVQAFTQAAPRAYGALTSLSPQARRELAEGILEAFAREADRRAALLKMTAEEAGAARRSAGDVRRFHVAMRQAIRQDAVALAQLGAGGPLDADDVARLARSIAEQEAYLQRFVEEVAAREALEAAGGRAAMSERAIQARGRMYGGHARAAFWEATAARQPAGIVAYFEGPGDGGVTCGPCADAVAGSPYLPADAPRPGAVCLGKGHCRHALRFVQDADAYARLTGQAERLAA